MWRAFDAYHVSERVLHSYAGWQCSSGPAGGYAKQVYWWVLLRLHVNSCLYNYIFENMKQWSNTFLFRTCSNVSTRTHTHTHSHTHYIYSLSTLFKIFYIKQFFMILVQVIDIIASHTSCRSLDFLGDFFFTSMLKFMVKVLPEYSGLVLKTI